MSLAENVELAHSFFKVWSSHDWDSWMALHAEGAVHEGPDQPEPLKGPIAIRDAHQHLENDFPDFRWDLKRAFGQDNLVCAEVVLRGTHRGTFHLPGDKIIPPTGNGVVVPATFVFTIEDGEVLHYEGYADFLGLFGQLGVGLAL